LFWKAVRYSSKRF